jgi:hypothetical protein
VEPRSSGGWRVEPRDQRGELLLVAGFVVVWVLAHDIGHFSVAVGGLPVLTARLMHHAEAIPAVSHFGISYQEIAGGRL